MRQPRASVAAEAPKHFLVDKGADFVYNPVFFS